MKSLRRAFASKWSWILGLVIAPLIAYSIYRTDGYRPHAEVAIRESSGVLNVVGGVTNIASERVDFKFRSGSDADRIYRFNVTGPKGVAHVEVTARECQAGKCAFFAVTKVDLK